MPPYVAELIGVAAACATLYAAHARTIIPLRVAAVAGNFLAMIYSLSYGAYPIFLLNAALLPLNAVRLHAMRKLIRDTASAANADPSSSPSGTATSVSTPSSPSRMAEISPRVKPIAPSHSFHSLIARWHFAALDAVPASCVQM